MRSFWSLFALLTVGCASSPVAPGPVPSSPVPSSTTPPDRPPERMLLCMGDDLRDFVPSLALIASVSKRLGGPQPVPGTRCPPSPPCFANGGVLACRGDVVASILRTAAAFAITRVETPSSQPSTFASHATSIAERAGAEPNEDIDTTIHAATSDAPPESERDARLAAVTRSIVNVPLTFLIGHELYHLRNNTCLAPISNTLRNRVRYMAQLDVGTQLFCKGDLDVGEVQADECGFAELERLPRSNLSASDAAYAARAGAALATWSILREFQTVSAGMIPTVAPIGYLRGGLRALLAASSAAPTQDGGRACEESAKLIVTAIQSETQRCETAGLPWGGDVPDPVLALLPPRVEQAWAGGAWTDETFICP